MKNKWLLYVVIFMLAVNAALVSSFLYQNWQSKENVVEYRKKSTKNYRKIMGGNFEQHLAQELELTEEQQSKISTYRDEFFSEKRLVKTELSDLRKEYFEVLSQEQPDTLVLDETVIKIADLESRQMKLEYLHYRNIRSVCTAEQAVKMDSLGRVHMKHHFDKRGREHKSKRQKCSDKN